MKFTMNERVRDFCTISVVGHVGRKGGKAPCMCISESGSLLLLPTVALNVGLKSSILNETANDIIELISLKYHSG